MTACLEIEDQSDRRWLWMNRPEARNAFEPAMIAALAEAFRRVAGDAEIRVVILAGRGSAFSAGADLGWMRRLATAPEDRNLEDARQLAAMFAALRACPQPVIARLHGPAIGGGVGLAAAADLAVASAAAWLQLAEVRLGLLPSVIAPYVIEAAGPRRARQWMLTAERIPATEAARHGLVSEVVAADALDDRIGMRAGELARGGPAALAGVKSLLRALAGRPIDAATDRETARRIALARATPEAREGMAAFFDRRRPDWDRG